MQDEKLVMSESIVSRIMVRTAKLYFSLPESETVCLMELSSPLLFNHHSCSILVCGGSS